MEASYFHRLLFAAISQVHVCDTEVPNTSTSYLTKFPNLRNKSNEYNGTTKGHQQASNSLDFSN